MYCMQWSVFIRFMYCYVLYTWYLWYVLYVLCVLECTNVLHVSVCIGMYSIYVRYLYVFVCICMYCTYGMCVIGIPLHSYVFMCM